MKPLFAILITFVLCMGLLLPASCRQPQHGRSGAASFRETFERGAKRAYAPGTVSLVSGPWHLDGALIGSSPQDLRSGAASLRLTAGGSAEMRFDLETLPDTVSFRFGAYGSDRATELSLWCSNDGGNHWESLSKGLRSQPGGSSDVSLSLDRGYHAPIRFRIRNDGAGRANVDDFGAGGLPAGSFNPAPAAGSRTTPAETTGDNDHLLLGNPGDARPDAASRENYLLRKPQYALSYNDARGTANWVSWHLSRSEQGEAPRCNCFSADAALPPGFYRVQSSNYIGSGFDRGHICASDDRSGSSEANAATFLMPNIAPQAPDLNQKCWRILEEHARRLTTQGKELYIISGVYGTGGTGTKGPASTIAKGRITVPAQFWKIIVVLPEGRDDLKRITEKTEVIAVDMPNKQEAGARPWQDFRCTVADIERATGCRFFSRLPPAVADALRKK